MISFVWSSRFPFLSGAGGSENYTAGQIRELQRRGIPCRIITIGFGEQDGRDNFPDIEFLALESKEQLAELDDTIVYITYPLDVITKHPSYAILHCPPPTFQHGDPQYVRRAFKRSHLITPSRYAARLWRSYLKTTQRISVVYPFAEQAFGRAVRSARHPQEAATKILFAGRLKPDKGIYTLLAALHMEQLQGMKYELTVTTSGGHTEDGQILLPMLEAHPLINLVPARHTPEDMAVLMTEHDVVVMPSSAIFWKETFGMVSVEAQHAGCRVVASRAGGLPETDCGGLLMVEPDHPQSLARGIARSVELGPLSAFERQFARQYFTVEASVDALLKALHYPPKRSRTSEFITEGANLLSPQLQRLSSRLMTASISTSDSRRK